MSKEPLFEKLLRREREINPDAHLIVTEIWIGPKVSLRRMRWRHRWNRLLRRNPKMEVRIFDE
jgi:hypothetical protein